MDATLRLRQRRLRTQDVVACLAVLRSRHCTTAVTGNPSAIELPCQTTDCDATARPDGIATGTVTAP
ncbi:MAG: hypothetical protein ABL997_13925 [Planctomycetota bacterium]